jgi:pyruvate dehydrogenase E1 component beta subunit
LALQASEELLKNKIDAEVIDLRILNPLNIDPIVESVKKTGVLLVVDGGWTHFGLSGEIIASVAERYSFSKNLPQRITIKNTPAPTSKVLEKEYYINADEIVEKVISMVE